MKEVFYNLFMIWKHLRLYNASTASLFVGPTPYKKGATLHAGLLKSCETFILYITNAKHKLNFRWND